MSVDARFTPNVPQCEVSTIFSLETEEFASSSIEVRGIGASSKIVLVDTQDEIDFGTLRPSTSVSKSVIFRNDGILNCNYFVESNLQYFLVQPERGILSGGGQVELKVTFEPRYSGALSDVIVIYGTFGEGYNVEPLYLKVRGTGNYPELNVITKEIDFGTALFNLDNIGQVQIENAGLADAQVDFRCYHRSITLSGTDRMIPANSSRYLDLIYHPTEVETLDIKVFVRSTDSRADYSMIHLKGIVGIPKLVFDPPGIFDNLDFGVCPTNQVHTKSFTMTNEGNIPLSFVSQLSMSFDRPIQNMDFGNTEYKAAQNPVVYVEPARGDLPVGESVTLKVQFVPSSIAEYSYSYTINYDFRKITTDITGTGGQAIISVEDHSQFVDFGTCRLGRVFKKQITLTNAGNLGVHYILRPEPFDKDWSVYDSEIDALNNRQIEWNKAEAKSTDDPLWKKYLSKYGFQLPEPISFSGPYKKSDIVLEFKPLAVQDVMTKLRLYVEGGYTKEFQIRGKAAIPQLSVYNPKTKKQLVSSKGNESENNSRIPEIDLGVFAVFSENSLNLLLMNEGHFGCDFLIQPTACNEFKVSPKRGFIESKSVMPLKVTFKPSAEMKFQMGVKVLWEGAPLRMNISAFGGLGKLSAEFIEERDISYGGLDFGDLPYNTVSEKRWLLVNTGKVPMGVQLFVTNGEYQISRISDAEPWKGPETKTEIDPKQFPVVSWFSSMSFQIPAQTFIGVAAKYSSSVSVESTGKIVVRSTSGDLPIPLRGKGGSVKLGVNGDLLLGDIASNFNYSRKLKLVNSGTISTPVDFVWHLAGQSTQNLSPTIRIVESYSSLDPRGGWARAQTIKSRANDGVPVDEPFSAQEHWAMIRKLITNPKSKLISSFKGISNIASAWDELLDAVMSRIKESPNPKTSQILTSKISSTDNFTGSSKVLSSWDGLPRRGSASSRRGSTNIATSDHQMIPSKRGLTSTGTNAAFFKRRNLFYHLITSSVVSSQASSTVKPFISVSPANTIIPRFGEVEVTVNLNLSAEDSFVARLLVRPQIVGVENLTIPLTASPKAVNIICDDTRMLNFHKQPVGESETITRTFTNIGRKNIRYSFVNPNSSLEISPKSGTLVCGESCKVHFIFSATNEQVQNSDVIFEPDCSQHIRFKFYGGGGHVKCSLSKYRRFDFGQCMMNKETVSYLPITNQGSAVIHLTRMELEDSEVFLKGQQWPNEK